MNTEIIQIRKCFFKNRRSKYVHIIEQLSNKKLDKMDKFDTFVISISFWNLILLRYLSEHYTV